MTKNDLTRSNNNNVRCLCCNKIFNKNDVHKGRIRQDGTVKMCKTCNWIHRHNGLPHIDGFTHEQIRYAIEFILLEKSLYVNDLADELDLSLDDAVNLVDGLKITNKHCYVKSKCEYCGKEIEDFISVYLKNKHSYCSHDCYCKHRMIIVNRGKNNGLYNRVQTNCTNCNKLIEVTPYRYNEINSFGDNHNFCSQKCYWEYRSKYYVKDKSSRIGSTVSQEHLGKMRRATVAYS